MRVGRNEKCPCGSGRKYKACCAEKHARATSRGLILLLAAIGAIAAAGLIAAMRDKEPQRPTPVPAASTPVATPRPQPPGPAPAGKVWSPEHGHWHDAVPQAQAQPQGGAPTVQVQQTKAGAPIPQPNVPVPPGKVWSAEHGHWHDVPKPK